MSDSKKRILEMLAENKITVDEAERLLSATGEKETEENSNRTFEEAIVRKMPKFLRIQVVPDPANNKDNVDKVNVRVPISLVRAGMKLTSLIPPQASDKMNEAMREKGINFDIKNIKPDDIDDLISALGDLEVDVEGATKVKVFAE